MNNTLYVWVLVDENGNPTIPAIKNGSELISTVSFNLDFMIALESQIVALAFKDNLDCQLVEYIPGKVINKPLNDTFH